MRSNTTHTRPISYKCFEKKNNFVLDYNSLRVTTGINEKANGSDHKVINRFTNLVNLFGWGSCDLSVRWLVCLDEIESHQGYWGIFQYGKGYLEIQGLSMCSSRSGFEG